MSERPFKQYTRLGFWTKLQIGVFLIVLLAMFLQYTLPLMSREGRAEKLYIDSWFEGTAFFSWMIELVTDTFLDDDEKHKISISKLEKALELSPGNPVYEQALARQYPPEELPKLLAESKLADKARWLANYRYYLYTARMNSEKMDKVISAECQKPVNERKYHVNGAHVYPDSYWRESLKNLDKLAAVIPECPMIYLHRAVIYSDMMQYEKMMKNIRKANTLDPYDPIWLDRLPQLNSTILAYGEKFIINESYTSKLITYGNNYGNQLLRKGKVDEAIHVYEDLCHFGIRYAQQQPYSIDTITRGAFLFFKSWDNLSPIYKDFDHRDRLKTYSEISGMFLDVYKVASDSFEKSLIYTTHVFDIFFWYSWLLILIIVGIIISTLTWVILGILHKRGKQESFHAAP